MIGVDKPILELSSIFRTTDDNPFTFKGTLEERLNIATAIVLSSKAKGDFEIDDERGFITGLGKFGCAVAVTNDGYFLTANHVLSHYGVLLYRQFTSLERVIEYRIVFQDDISDIAIIKASVFVFFPLEFSEEPTDVGMVVYNGGNHDSKMSIGEITGIEVKEGASINYSAVEYTAPSVSGDSGCAVVDASGRIVGIHKGASYTVTKSFWRSHEEFKSLFTSSSYQTISRIIEEDRETQKANQAAHATPATAQH